MQDAAAPRQGPPPAGPTLSIRPWWEPALAVHGHDPLDPYAETHWLPVLGPSAMCALRWATRRLRSAPQGFETDLREFARCLGLGRRLGANSPARRCLERLCYFHLGRIRHCGTGDPGDNPPVLAYAVRTHLPEVPGHLQRKLPRSLRQGATGAR